MIGTYVTYKNQPWLVVRETGGMVLILRPGNEKLQVARRNVQTTSLRPVIQVEYELALYLVTRKGMIVSRTTGRVMKWTDDQHERRDILALAGVHVPMDLGVIDYLGDPEAETPTVSTNPFTGARYQM